MVHCDGLFFFFKQNTAYEMRISDWSSDVCSSDLPRAGGGGRDRTDDLVLAKHALSQLSYAPRSAMARPVTAALMVGQGRLELQIGRASCRERVSQYV